MKPSKFFLFSAALLALTAVAVVSSYQGAQAADAERVLSHLRALAASIARWN